MEADIIVHIVDDEEAIRKSLTFLLSMSGFAARAHESANAFLAAAPQLHSACLVTDLRMPEMSGLDLLNKLRAINPDVPVILITGHGDVPMAVEAMKAGAIDFIEKPFEDEVLLDAIRRACMILGKKSLQPQESRTIRSRMEHLTERERQVLAAIAAGQPNKTIAYELNISPRTVEVHRANVMAKMQARSLPELVRMVIAADRIEAPNDLP